MIISKKLKLESREIIFYHILANFGGSRPKTQEEDRFLLIFQKSSFKVHVFYRNPYIFKTLT